MKISDSIVLLQAQSRREVINADWQTHTPIEQAGRANAPPGGLSFQELLNGRLSNNGQQGSVPGFVSTEMGPPPEMVFSPSGHLSLLERMSRITTIKGKEEFMAEQRNIFPLHVGKSTLDRRGSTLFGFNANRSQSFLSSYHAFVSPANNPFGFKDIVSGIYHDDFQQGTPRQPGNFRLISNTLARTNAISAPVMPQRIRQDDWHMDQDNQVLNFSAVGSVLVDDGRQINFDLNQLYEQSVTSLSADSHTFTPSPWIDPLILDLDGSGIEFTDDFFDFDLDADGELEQFACFEGGCGFLAYDSNQDGSINDGGELFGAISGNGFADIAQYDMDGNYWIDENDDIYSDLSIWSYDEAGNDILQSLQEADVGAIYLANVDSSFSIASDDGEIQGRINGSGVYLTEGGDVKSIHQMDLAARELETAENESVEQVPGADSETETIDGDAVESGSDTGSETGTVEV